MNFAASPLSGKRCASDGVERDFHAIADTQLSTRPSSATPDDRSNFHADAALGNCFAKDHQLPVLNPA
jgi:hypothetical protein